MRKLLIAGLLAASALAAAPASASKFVGTFDVNAADSDPGLKIAISPTVNTLDFSLSKAGQVYSVANLFTIASAESSVDLDDLLPRLISTAFTFTSPTALGGTINGITSGVISVNLKKFQTTEYGQLTWGSPIDLTFGNGGDLRITLNNTTFGSHTSGLFNGAINSSPSPVGASFELISAGVPEPATWALMIGGFGLAGVTLRRRRNQMPMALA